MNGGVTVHWHTEHGFLKRRIADAVLLGDGDRGGADLALDRSELDGIVALPLPIREGSVVGKVGSAVATGLVPEGATLSGHRVVAREVVVQEISGSHATSIPFLKGSSGEVGRKEQGDGKEKTHGDGEVGVVDVVVDVCCVVVAEAVVVQRTCQRFCWKSVQRQR